MLQRWTLCLKKTDKPWLQRTYIQHIFHKHYCTYTAVKCKEKKHKKKNPTVPAHMQAAPVIAICVPQIVGEHKKLGSNPALDEQ